MDVREGAGEMLWMYTPFRYVVKKNKRREPLLSSLPDKPIYHIPVCLKPYLQ